MVWFGQAKIQEILELEQLQQGLLLYAGHMNLMKQIENSTVHTAALVRRFQAIPNEPPCSTSQGRGNSEVVAASSEKHYLLDGMSLKLLAHRDDEIKMWAVVTVVEGRRMPTRDMLGTLNLYCVVLLAGDRLITSVHLNISFSTSLKRRGLRSYFY